jgi:tetratricopeptide (TPR) repeat protein/predicted Ser/Thr protein kinase
MTCHNQFGEEHVQCPTDQTMLVTPPADPLAGSALADQYETERLIGSGGWSLVYRAKQKSLGRPVAIKILHSHLMFDPDKVMRFQREAESASKFNHPAIPSVYDFGVMHTGQPYMIMAYVEGRSLAEVVAQDGPLPFDKAVDIFIQTASGLQSAHERGVIHRDIKPSNILLTKDKGEVKILDFGLAKLVDIGAGEVAATLTQAGHTIGTPAYMSPEQCLGQNLDARSDIYSLGCVMFEMVTGQRPFEGRDAFEAMSLHLRGDISFDETAIKETIPPAVEACILKALEKNPADRYQSAQELTNALSAIHSQNQMRHSAAHRVVASFQKIVKQKSRNLNHGLFGAVITGLVVLTLVLAAYRMAEYSGAVRRGPTHNLAETYKDLMTKGERQFYAGNYPRASELFQQGADLAENFGATDERLSNSLKRLEASLRKDNRIKEAEKVAEHMDALRNSNYGLMYGTPAQNAQHIMALTARRDQHPNDVNVARQLCAVLNNQAALLFTQSNVADAKQFLDRAMDIEKTVLGENDPEYATSLSNLAYYYSQRGDKVQAEEYYKQALALRQKVLGSSDPKVGRSLRNLADFYWQQGDVKRAQELMAQAIEVYRKQLPKTSADYAWAVNNLGLILASQRNYAEARKQFMEALELRKQLYGANGLDVGRTIHNLAQLDTAERRYSDAETEFRDALRIYDNKLGIDHQDTLKCVSNLAGMYYNQKNYADAEPLLKRIVGVMGPKKPDDPMVVQSYTLLSQMYRQQNRKGELDKLEQTMRDAAKP